MTTRAELLPLLAIARKVGTLQGRLRLLIDVLPVDVRDDATEVAELLDQADEALTKLFIDHAPQPRGRAA